MPFDQLVGDLSFFVPASVKPTPQKARASIYSAAHTRGISVNVFKTTENGIDGFRVFRAQKPEARAS